MTTETKGCSKCGRQDGHYIGCERITLLLPLDDSVCQEPDCEDPVKSARAQYCAEHSSQSARTARHQRARKAQDEQENADV